MKTIHKTTTELSLKWHIQSFIKEFVVNNTAIFLLGSFYSASFIKFPDKGEIKPQTLQIVAFFKFF